MVGAQRIRNMATFTGNPPYSIRPYSFGLPVTANGKIRHGA